MTIIEMHSLCDVITDKNNAPWFTPSEKDKWIQLAELEFVKQKVLTYEVDEKGREDLLTLVKRRDAGSVLSINLDLAPIIDLMYIVQVFGDYTNKCGSVHTEPIVPVQLDDQIELMKDPFFKLDDFSPGYIQTNENNYRELQIKSESTPTNVILRYIKKPRLVLNDIAVPGNNVDSELPVHIHEEIVNIATRKMLGTVQDQFQYQVQQNEENKT